MTRYGTKDFMSSVGRKRGKYAKLTKLGKMVGFMHPKFGFQSRQRHGSFIPVEWETTRDGERVVEIQGRTFNCAGKGCPLELLSDFADKAIQDGANQDELILDGGRDSQSWTLGQLAGKTTGATAWKYDLKAKTEYIVGWISAEPEEQESENPVQLLTIGTGLGNAIKSAIENRQDSVGDTVGDPMQTPYGLKLIYKKDETPAKKYQAYYADEREAPITNAVKEIMQADEQDLGLDMKSQIAPTDKNDILKALRSTWISRTVTFEMFLESVGLAVEGGKEPEQESKPPADEKQPTEAGNKKFCPECGAIVQPGVKFCPECGKQQMDDEPASQPPVESSKQQVKCPDCEQMVEPSRFGYCPNCGKKGLDVPF